MNIRNSSITLLGFAAVIALAQPPMGGGDRMGRERPPVQDQEQHSKRTIMQDHQPVWQNERLHADLGMSPDQRTSLKVYADSIRLIMKPKHKEAMTAHDALIEQLSLDPRNAVAIAKAQEKVRTLETQELEMRMAAEARFFQILTESQRKRFIDLHEKMKYERQQEEKRDSTENAHQGGGREFKRN